MNILTSPSLNNILDYSTEKILRDSEFYFHSAIEIVICTKGSITIEFSKEYVNLSEGEALLINPFVMHRIKLNKYEAKKICLSINVLKSNFSQDAFYKYVSVFFSDFQFCVISKKSS